MYFINNFSELVGKTIAYIDMESDMECFIGTTDGGILVFDIYSDEPPYIKRNTETKYFLLNNSTLVDKLISNGMPIADDYYKLKREHHERLEKERMERERQKEQKEYEQYLKLKEKFDK